MPADTPAPTVREETRVPPNWEAFGREILTKAYEYGGGDVDGGDLQDTALKHGCLVETAVTEPCDSEHCVCAEVDAFPLTCYRIPKPTTRTERTETTP